mmetsp:Transcript_18467/g.69874  ORF Transcript_18467/g.69874 Transcript_18467/m.69874 type:complete len:248 (-) Transcript_18467:208-951(-)
MRNSGLRDGVRIHDIAEGLEVDAHDILRPRAAVGLSGRLVQLGVPLHQGALRQALLAKLDPCLPVLDKESVVEEVLNRLSEIAGVHEKVEHAHGRLVGVFACIAQKSPQRMDPHRSRVLALLVLVGLHLLRRDGGHQLRLLVRRAARRLLAFPCLSTEASVHERNVRNASEVALARQSELVPVGAAILSNLRFQRVQKSPGVEAQNAGTETVHLLRGRLGDHVHVAHIQHRLARPIHIVEQRVVLLL